MRKQGIFGLVLALALLAVIGSAVRLIWCPGRPLDATVWHEEAQGAQGIRLDMADRLVAQDTLLGKSRAEVVALLGEPPPTPYFRNWDMVYWLGPERGFIRIDSEWLVLRLGADSRVIENRIVRD